MERSPPTAKSFRFGRACERRGEAAWAGERNDPSVGRAKSRQMFLLTGVLRLPACVPSGVPSGVPMVFWCPKVSRLHVHVSSHLCTGTGGNASLRGRTLRIEWPALVFASPRSRNALTVLVDILHLGKLFFLGASG